MPILEAAAFTIVSLTPFSDHVGQTTGKQMAEHHRAQRFLMLINIKVQPESPTEEQHIKKKTLCYMTNFSFKSNPGSSPPTNLPKHYFR